MNNLIPVIIVLLLIAGIIAVIKASIRIAISLFIALILFGVGFAWSSDDFKDRVPLDKFLKPEVAEKVYDFSEDFEKKREESSILDSEKMQEAYRDTEDKLSEKGSGLLGSIKDLFFSIFDDNGDVPKEEGSVPAD